MRGIGKIGEQNVCITNHALERMVDMGLTVAQIKDLITNPTEVYQSKKYPDHTCHRNGDYSIAFLVKNSCMIIKTVLYGSQMAWLKAFKDGSLDHQGRNIDWSIFKSIPKYSK